MSTDKKTGAGKLRWHLLPLKELEHAVIAFEAGCDKYGPDTWKHYDSTTRERYLSSLLRHIVAYASGELKDPETGASHLGHGIANCLILIHHELKGRFSENR